VTAGRPSAFTVRAARSAGTQPDADLAHASVTDPEGALVAVDARGRTVGSAVAAVREDTLLLLSLEVNAADRGRGAGRSLLAAARAYGTARGAGALEVLAPDEPAALGFLLRDGLSVRTLVLSMAAKASPEAPASFGALHAVGPGAPLSGWIAALDRETRGFFRPREWARWGEIGRVVSLRRAGRAVAIGALRTGPSGAVLGPIAARTPESAAELLALLVASSKGERLSLELPADSRALLLAASRFGFRALSTRVLLADRKRGDLRRYAGGGGRFF
jgi:GNAT superfamily N-acetyltransferase